MQKKENTQSKKDTTKMIAEKTNEDYNKKKPDPKDPNEEKSHPNTGINESIKSPKSKKIVSEQKIYYGEEDYENDEK